MPYHAKAPDIGTTGALPTKAPNKGTAGAFIRCLIASDALENAFPFALGHTRPVPMYLRGEGRTYAPLPLPRPRRWAWLGWAVGAPSAIWP